MLPSDYGGLTNSQVQYRLRNADALALKDIDTARLKQYQLLTRALAARLSPVEAQINPQSPFEEIFRVRFGSIFKVIDKYLHGNPSGDFHINLKTGGDCTG